LRQLVVLETYGRLTVPSTPARSSCRIDTFKTIVTSTVNFGHSYVAFIVTPTVDFDFSFVIVRRRCNFLQSFSAYRHQPNMRDVSRNTIVSQFH
jgi:hypothetical protein